MSQTPIVLINTNSMKPPVAPIALDYLAGALTERGHEVEILDLCFAENARKAIEEYFAGRAVRAVGMTFRNSDDCFWPSGKSFIPRLQELVRAVRAATDAPVILGGAGFSVFPEAILDACGADFGVQGDGEEALPQFLRALDKHAFGTVPGLLWREGKTIRRNAVRPLDPVKLNTSRAWVDNPRYFREGGQAGVETKRGCNQPCVYCADILSKGRAIRLRAPEEVAAEVESLLQQGIDVLHICDSEFNVPPDHALTVCREMIRRGLGGRARWYTYAAISGFPEELARAMREAGCVGINFGADSAGDIMLASYGRPHRRADIASAVSLCRKHGMKVMLDLLLGGPGETEDTLRDTVEFMRTISPDCVGAALGVRVYPGTQFADMVEREGPLTSNRSLRFGQTVATDSAEPRLRPVFYVSRAIGDAPAQLIRRLIAGDPRFFEPVDEQIAQNYNYNDNLPLCEAIRKGARGAYWDILRQMRHC